MNVLFVIYQAGREADGGVTSITNLIERLRCIRPVVVTHAESAFTDRWRGAGVDIHLWLIEGPRAPRVRRVPSTIASNVRLFWLARSISCKVVHCNDTLSFWNSAFGARLSGAVIVNNVRDTKAPDEMTSLRKWRLALRLTHCQLVLSRDMRAFWIEALKPTSAREQQSRKFVDIYSAVDPVVFRPPTDAERARERARVGVPEGCFAVGYVAGFVPKKAQLRFIERALPRMRASLPSAKVFFVGDFSPEEDAYARACRDAVRRLGLDNTVVFVGFESAVERWYRAVDVVVLGSRAEGLARCMIESIACGTPVVSFDVCSAREILEGHRCGCVVPQGDYGGMIEEIVLLERDEALRRQLGENGAAAARELFDPDQIVARYEALYRRLVAERRERSRWP